MTNSMIEAGQVKPEQNRTSKFSDEYIAAINQCFAVFKRNYHNQFFKAFADEKELAISKKLWADSLNRFQPALIVKATRRLIEQEAFLPTLKTMIDHCEAQLAPSLGDPYSAYLEACHASTPKANHAWSHPLVYHVGQKTGWRYLASTPEQQAYPRFKDNFQQALSQLREGLRFEQPEPERLEHRAAKPISVEDNKERAKNLLDSL